jgi:hypothetical protein
VRLDRLPVALPTFTHVTCTARGWSQRRSAAGRSASPRGLLRGRDLLGRERISTPVRTPRARAFQNNSMIIFQPPGHFAANWIIRGFALARELVASKRDEARDGSGWWPDFTCLPTAVRPLHV